jgi:hypothetical protein
MLKRDPYLLETSVPIFADGDVRHGVIRWVASAVGQCAVAVCFVHHSTSRRCDGATVRRERREMTCLVQSEPKHVVS